MNPFSKYLKENNIKDISLIESEQETHTAQQAAKTHNVPVSSIVKSLLIFKENEYVLYLIPGDERLDLEKIEGRMANAEEVKEITGYSIGGVPPFGHKKDIKTYIDDRFEQNQTLLAAGGKPNVVFKITLEKLKKLVCTN
jgi:prolyl-tRNA editing enzyme YbaK/EbsC (Cys-tRNA(Pro) deacylase)